MNTSRRTKIRRHCIGVVLLGLHLLHPVNSFTIAVSTPSSTANLQFCRRFTSSPPKHLQNRLLAASSATSSDSSAATSNSNPVRKVTGFSLTAIRTTIRGATGFSLTTLRATLRAATGISLSKYFTTLITTLTGILPARMRYFLQPFLIMYYAPMMIVRYYMVGPNRKYVEESQMGHERVVEGWRKAVEAAELAQQGGYWPVHLNDDGTITASLPPDADQILDITDGIEKSVEFEQELSKKT